MPAETQLQSFINKFAPKHSALIRAVRKVLRKRLPTANELVWDNYNFFVLSYGSTERPSDCIVTIAAAANGVGLSFYRGASLPDPKKILLGSGTQNRFIRVESADVWRVPKSRRSSRLPLLRPKRLCQPQAAEGCSSVQFR
jgi:hypothetical protein